MTEQALLSRQQSTARQDVAPSLIPEKPELTTGDVIFPSEDSASKEINIQSRDPHETLVENGLKSEELLYEKGLDIKVKTELIAQFFNKQFFDKEQPTTGAIDISKIAAVIKTEMKDVAENNAHFAQHLENVEIPKANVRQREMLATQGEAVAKNIEKDIDRLYARVEISTIMAERIEAQLSELSDPEELMERAEKYVRRLKDEAKKEAIAILVQKKEEFKQKKDELERQMVEISARILDLSGEPSQPNPESAQAISPEQYSEIAVHGLAGRARSFAHNIGNKIKIAQ